MKPENSRSHLESGTPTEERESAEGKPKLKEQSTPEMVRARLRELEQVVVTDIRKRFADLILGRDMSFLERLATVAVLTQALELQSQILANEPLADDAPKIADSLDLAQIDPSLLPPDEDVQARLKSFMRTIEIDGQKYTANIDMGERSLNPEQLNQPLIISELGDVSFQRFINANERQKLVDSTWQRGSDGDFKIIVDKYGNRIECELYELDPVDQPGVWIEIISVQTSLQFADTDSAQNKPVGLDFSDVDPALGEIDTGIYQQELLPLGTAGGIPVYVDDPWLQNFDGHSSQTIMDQFVSEQDYIDSGVRFIYALYGSQPEFKGYVVSDSNEVNAFANYRDDTIIFNYALLKSTEERWNAHTAIELVASHEAAHHTNKDHGIYTHPMVEVVFIKYGERLRRLNESVLFGEAGGHAQKNTNELCASIIASLAHDRWEESAQALSSEDRSMYLDVLVAIEQAHLDAVSFKEPILQGLREMLGTPDTLTGNEPIFRLLHDRIERLNQMNQ